MTKSQIFLDAAKYFSNKIWISKSSNSSGLLRIPIWTLVLDRIDHKKIIPCYEDNI